MDDPVIRRQIHELPKQVADKIAAGEVVDRPLSIVKELLENAIDAGAGAIAVEIKNGGKSYIRVTDNGCGIEKDQADLAFKRHATSKIEEAADLDRISTLGFRGEALASIAAVSRAELITKTREAETGFKLRIEGGECAERGETGCPDGTTLVISDLFYNTPARMKFMKPDNTESTLIIDFVSKMALAYPGIKIRLINNGSILFSTPGKGDIYTNILTIYSREIGEKLIRVEAAQEGMKLTAYVSPPSQSRANRKSQVFFVNGRWIFSKLLESAVSDAYAEKLFEGRYPIAFLFLSVAPESLDVNIHPNKKEVRFDDEKTVRQFVSAALRRGLSTKEAVAEIRRENLFRMAERPAIKEEPKGQGEKKAALETAAAFQRVFPDNGEPSKMDPGKQEIKRVSFGLSKKKEEQVDIKSFLSTKREKEREAGGKKLAAAISQLKAGRTPSAAERDEGAPQGNIAEEPTLYQPRAEETPKEKSFAFREMTPTGTIFNTYITAVDGQFFYLIDQHAAHERIFYEELLAAYNREERHSQMLLSAFVVELPFAVKNNAQDFLLYLEKIGYHLEEFGAKSFLVKEIPAMMELSEAEDFLNYFLDNVSADFTLKDQAKVDKIIMKACKSAVKAKDHLDIREINALLRDLEKTENPFTCPHGRPTFIKLSKYQIEKLFKRV